MRVLQVHNRHATRGGADDVLDQERVALLGAGHEVTGFVPGPAGEQQRSRAAQAVDAVWNRALAAELAAVIRARRPDVVHVHTPFPVLSPAVFRVAHDLGCPTIATAHSYRYSCVAGTLLRDGRACELCVGRRLKTPGVRHRCYHGSLPGSAALTTSLALHRALGTFAHKVDRFITLTAFGRERLLQEGVPRDHVVVKANAVDDPGAPTAGVGADALFVGRLVEEKGVRTLLDAWRRVPGDARLRIAGDGPLRGLVDDAARTDPRVVPLGWLDETGVAHAVAGARIVVVCSEWYEAGPPLVLLRALAAGRPSVCADLENISAAVVAAGAAVPFRTRDADDLARTLEHALTDDAWATAAGRAARAHYLAEHTPERSLRALLDTYASAAAARGRSLG